MILLLVSRYLNQTWCVDIRVDEKQRILFCLCSEIIIEFINFKSKLFCFSLFIKRWVSPLSSEEIIFIRYQSKALYYTLWPTHLNRLWASLYCLLLDQSLFCLLKKFFFWSRGRIFLDIYESLREYFILSELKALLMLDILKLLGKLTGKIFRWTFMRAFELR